MMILAAVFGGYFWLLVPVRLPDFYDENRIGFYWDYCFRMNLPGVAFNNANWPRVVAVMRAWSCLVLALLPFLSGADPLSPGSGARSVVSVPVFGQPVPPALFRRPANLRVDARSFLCYTLE